MIFTAQADIILLDSYQLRDVCRITPGFTSADSARLMKQDVPLINIYLSKFSIQTPKMLDLLIEYY